MALARDTRLGVYEVTARLGEGGMGETWRNRAIRRFRTFATVE